MRMIMTDNKENTETIDDLESEFQKITQEYLRASEILAEATGLAGDDPIKQDMVAFIQPQFIEMCAKAEGVRALSIKAYHENKKFILEEMKEITRLNLDMAQQIKTKLGFLTI